MSGLFSIFSGSELLRVAIETEHKGEEFYQAVAEKSRSDEARRIFKQLAAVERVHAKRFEELAVLLPTEENLDSEPGEFESYARALLETSVFAANKSGQELAHRAASDLEAIDAALAFEKDTILFLNDMLDYAQEEAAKVVDAILDQEKQHLVQLTELRRAIESKG